MTDPRPRLRFARSSSVDTDGLHSSYNPETDGRADPGEVVWTWVPYEEDPHQGKDRPLLVVARRDGVLYGLMLSSNPKRAGDDDWLELGAGAWDGEQRVSFVRLDRVLELAEDGIRREGATVRREQFDRIVRELRAEHGWG